MYLLKNLQPCLHQCITHHTVVWWLSVEKEMSCNFALEKCHFFGTLLLWAIKFLHTQGSDLMCWQKWLALPPLCATPISDSLLWKWLRSLSALCCIQIEWLIWKNDYKYAKMTKFLNSQLFFTVKNPHST